MPMVSVQGDEIVQVCAICGAEKTLTLADLRTDTSKDDPDPSMFYAPECGVDGCRALEGCSWHDEVYSQVVEESMGLLDPDDLDEDNVPRVKWVAALKVEPNPEDFRARHMENIAIIAEQLGCTQAHKDKSPEWFTYGEKPAPLDREAMVVWRKRMKEVAAGRFGSSDLNPRGTPKDPKPPRSLGGDRRP